MNVIPILKKGKWFYTVHKMIKDINSRNMFYVKLCNYFKNQIWENLTLFKWKIIL